MDELSLKQNLGIEVGTFNEDLRTLADNKFAALFEEAPERAALAAERSEHVVRLCETMLDESFQIDPARPTLLLAAKKFLFLFSEPDHGEREQETLESDLSMILFKHLPDCNFNMMAAANAVDTRANWIMALYMEQAKGAFPVWESLSPVRKLWFVQGYVEGSYKHDFE